MKDETHISCIRILRKFTSEEKRGKMKDQSLKIKAQRLHFSLRLKKVLEILTNAPLSGIIRERNLCFTS
jgi:hypothetical protein